MVARESKKVAGKSSSEDFRKKVEKKAYEIWQKRGCSHGSDWSDWFEAEKAINSKKQ
jgi:hypothetical protein